MQIMQGSHLMQNWTDLGFAYSESPALRDLDPARSGLSGPSRDFREALQQYTRMKVLKVLRAFNLVAPTKHCPTAFGNRFIEYLCLLSVSLCEFIT